MEVCSLKDKCGGCRYQGVDYAEQLNIKQAYVEKLFSGIISPMPIIGMDEPKYYRNKTHHALAFDKKRGIYSGQYATRSHRVLYAEECMLEDKLSQQIIATICLLAKSFKYTVYDEVRRSGLIRHILIRRGFTSDEVMVVLVCSSAILPGKNNFIKALINKHPEITTVVLNVNTRYDSMVLGDKNVTLHGKGYITDTLCSKIFRISPDSFYQINPVQTEKLYKIAVDFAELTGRETVIDAYCGIGTIGLSTSDKAKQVIGVEININAVRDAIINCKLNDVSNCRFICGDAGKFMCDIAADGNIADVVFMDPPRSGSTPEFISAVLKLSPSRIVYISCDPSTQVRDVKMLMSGGYKPVKLQPVDMFPYTEHVETVMLLMKHGS